MWEKWEQRYSDHLPLHFNDLNLYVNEHKAIHQATSACKNKTKPYQLISNYKTKIITFFIWPRGASENMFEGKGMLLLVFCIDIKAHIKKNYFLKMFWFLFISFIDIITSAISSAQIARDVICEQYVIQ